MSQAKGSFEPAFSDAERDELAHLHYLDARLDELRARELIAPDAYATVIAETQSRREAIELSGSYRNAITLAKRFAKKNPTDALHWAECAWELDPGREEAWDLIVGLHCERGDTDQAIACCGEAAGRFPRFQKELDQLRAAKIKLAEEEKRQAERAREDTAIKGWFAQARRALDNGRDAEAIALGQQILAVRPDHVDALATAAFAQQRSGQFEQALTSYRTLCRLQPSNGAWLQWVRNVQLRSSAERMTGKAPEHLVQRDAEGERAAGPRTAEADAPPPPISWSGFAGE
jgi:tetratricopeptide (TPR) repeat protein